MEVRSSMPVSERAVVEHARWLRPISGSRILRDGLKPGSPAPMFRLPSVDGSEVRLRDFHGRQVLLVFSDPECSPCAELAPRLEAVHRSSPELAVVMVSRRGVDVNKSKIAEFQLTFPVALQRSWEVSREYGIFETPVAFRIGANGVIVAPVAVGVDAILALAKREEASTLELVHTRLDALRREFETGQIELDRVERRRSYLRETLLRIQGAIDVLEELGAAGPNGNGAAPAHILSGGVGSVREVDDHDRDP